MTSPFCLAKSASWFLLLPVFSLNWIYSKIISEATFHIIGLTKIPKIEFLPLDWIYHSIRIITVSEMHINWSPMQYGTYFHQEGHLQFVWWGDHCWKWAKATLISGWRNLYHLTHLARVHIALNPGIPFWILIFLQSCETNPKRKAWVWG